MKNASRVYTPKGWGLEETIVNTPAYCGKRMHIFRGLRSSWHYHQNKDETFLVVQGLLKVVLATQEEITAATRHGWTEQQLLYMGAFPTCYLGPGDSLRVRPGTRHRFESGADLTIFVEFSTHDDPADTIRVLRGD